MGRRPPRLQGLPASETLDVVYTCPNLGRSERWVPGKAQVGARAFQVGRDAVSAANHRLAMQGGRRPGEAEAGLDSRKSVHRVVERAAVAVHPCELECSGGQIQVGLEIVEFDPGCRCFVAQPKIQSQSRGDTPVVLTVSSESPCKLMPDKTGADAVTSGFRIAEEEIGCRITGEIAREGKMEPYSPLLPV